MKNYVSLLTLIGILVSTNFALANVGGMEGGGGQGMLCMENVNGVMQNVLEPLDVYEAKNIWGYDIPPSLDLKSEVKRISLNAKLFADTSSDPKGKPVPATDQEVERFINGSFATLFTQNLIPIPKGTRLNLSSDSGDLILKPTENCILVQVFFYADQDVSNGRILVDQEYWNLLSPQGQLAFFWHETLYKSLRNFGETNSQRTRKIVGMIMANKEFPGPNQSLYGQKDVQTCAVDVKPVDSGYIHFHLLPFSTDLAKEMKTKLVFDSLSSNYGEDSTFVDTDAYSMWSYDDWKSRIISVTPRPLMATFSALGSRMIRIEATNPTCIGSGKPCDLKMYLLNEDNKWIGGAVSCHEGY